jgi:DNA repair ATPase RecN
MDEDWTVIMGKKDLDELEVKVANCETILEMYKTHIQSILVDLRQVKNRIHDLEESEITEGLKQEIEIIKTRLSILENRKIVYPPLCPIKDAYSLNLNAIVTS